ncbi:hypothetical protein [European catfish virus]|uniref:Uncharacterized protein n=1 Tax=European catfish virus TaxID=84739 RepID=I2BFR9_9VIRU|nr:hypothetical protein A190_gp089 [European catfish virus]AFJ52372.1 hypothetical protein [European catfish virus]AMZ04918.1 hypothetical protein [European catfish virus]AMZ05054.1 hypothetical protein [European catfish virus]
MLYHLFRQWTVLILREYKCCTISISSERIERILDTYSPYL